MELSACRGIWRSDVFLLGASMQCVCSVVVGFDSFQLAVPSKFIPLRHTGGVPSLHCLLPLAVCNSEYWPCSKAVYNATTMRSNSPCGCMCLISGMFMPTESQGQVYVPSNLATSDCELCNWDARLHVYCQPDPPASPYRAWQVLALHMPKLLDPWVPWFQFSVPIS
jgi:hypothetical protein